MKDLKSRRIVLRAGTYVPGTKIKVPQQAAMVAEGASPAAAIVTAPFQITFTGFSEEAKRAFQAAVDVWSLLLTTSVPIRVNAVWTALDSGVLGSAGPGDYRHDFTGAPQAGTWYPVSLANKIANSDLSPGVAHIEASFSSAFPNWYFGTDGNTPNDSYDLMSVILHEIGHGLGFIGSMDVENGVGSWGLGTAFPIIYDRFAEDGANRRLLDTAQYPNNSTALAGVLQSNQVFFDATRTTQQNGGAPARLYAPIQWDGGSSYSHLNETIFSPGNPNSLMTPQLGLGESIHNPGPLGLAMLADMGW